MPGLTIGDSDVGEAFDKLPSIEQMQKAAKRAYGYVQKVYDEYHDKGQDSIPARVWSKLHDHIAGAIGYDTFAGRRCEWEK